MLKACISKYLGSLSTELCHKSTKSRTLTSEGFLCKTQDMKMGGCDSNVTFHING